MVLSSNWLDLQKSKKVFVKRKPSKKSSQVTKKPNNDVNGVRKIQYTGKSSRIMDMVYNMNKEIAKVKDDKANGKEFTFNTKDTKNVELEEKLNEEINLSNKSFEAKLKNIGKYLAIDCEFVGIGLEGKESALARVSLVNYFGHVIIDDFVKPRDTVTDWRTWVSGIKPENMKQAIPFKEAQKKMSDILEGRILIGHAVKHDLESLLISHPKSMIRDTSRHLPFRKQYAMGKIPSLKKLAKEVLKIEIQDGKHSSVEDARATMLIYKSDKKEFEKLHNASNQR